MKYYSVAELVIEDEGWLAEYIPNVTRLVHQHGGRDLSRTDQVEKVEGTRPLPGVVVLLEFPSKHAAQAFYDDPAYRPYRDQRQSGSHAEFMLVAGEDMTQRRS